MRRWLRALPMAVGLWSNQLLALEPGSIGETPVLFEVSESGGVYYNVDNRDTRPSQVPTRVNDNFGLLYNRLNLQATAGSVSAGVRVDNVWFYASPAPSEVALSMTRESPREDAPGYFRNKLGEAGLELSNRYINWVYPAKYYLTLSKPGLEATLGDASAQLGRGIVLSVRKQDELGSDTTVRGARLSVSTRGAVGLKLTALGGEMNPLRIDQASGRYLGIAADGDLLHTLAGAGMPRAIATDFAPLSSRCETSPTCTYAPDRVLGGQFELSTADFTLGSQGAVLLRDAGLSDDVVRSSPRVVTLSQSLDLPRFVKHTAVYAELAFQHLAQPQSVRKLDAGYGVYASASYTPAGAAITVEGRHYRRLFPLYANVKLARAHEFSSLAYNAIPTTAPTDSDTEFEGMNSCVSGARARADFRVAPGVRALASAAHYLTYAESSANEECSTEQEQENRVYDASSGFALDSRDRSRHLEVVMGGRLDRAERDLILPGGGLSRLFYTESYLRHQLDLPLFGAFSMSLSGRHRRRNQAEGGPGATWLDGEEVLGVEWAEHSSLALGTEYTTRAGVPGTYFNLELSHRPSPATRIALFAGQQRGAQRCVAGICRLYPAFEGARLDFSTRF